MSSDLRKRDTQIQQLHQMLNNPEQNHHEKTAAWVAEKSGGENTISWEGLAALWNVVRARYSYCPFMTSRNPSARVAIFDGRVVCVEFDPVAIKAAVDRNFNTNLPCFEQSICTAFVDSLEDRVRENLWGLAVVGASRSLEEAAYASTEDGFEEQLKGGLSQGEPVVGPVPQDAKWVSLALVWRPNADLGEFDDSLQPPVYHCVDSDVYVKLAFSRHDRPESYWNVPLHPLARSSNRAFALCDLEAKCRPPQISGDGVTPQILSAMQEIGERLTGYAKTRMVTDAAWTYHPRDGETSMSGAWDVALFGMPFSVPCPVSDTVPGFAWFQPRLSIRVENARVAAGALKVYWMGYDHELQGYGCWPFHGEEKEWPTPPAFSRGIPPGQPVVPEFAAEEVARVLSCKPYDSMLANCNVAPTLNTRHAVKYVFEFGGKRCEDLLKAFTKLNQKARQKQSNISRVFFDKCTTVFTASAESLSSILAPMRFGDEMLSARYQQMQGADISILQQDGGLRFLRVYTPWRRIKVDHGGMDSTAIVCASVCTVPTAQHTVETSVRLVIQYRWQDELNEQPQIAEIRDAKDALDFGLEWDGAGLDAILGKHHHIGSLMEHEDLTHRFIEAYNDIKLWMMSNTKALMPRTPLASEVKPVQVFPVPGAGTPQ